MGVGVGVRVDVIPEAGVEVGIGFRSCSEVQATVETTVTTNSATAAILASLMMPSY